MTRLLLLAQTLPESSGAAPAARTFADLVEGLPLGWTGVLAAGLALGLVLLILGNRLAKLGVMLCGLIIGGLGAVAAATQVSGAAAGGPATPGTWLLAFGIGGGLAGVLLAWLLFRFWMAASAALVLAAVVPLSAMIWEGNGPELSSLDPARRAAEAALAAVEERVASTPTADRDLVGPPAPGRVPAADTDSAADRAAAATDDDAESEGGAEAGPGGLALPLIDHARLIDDVRGVYTQQAEEVRLWWSELPIASRRVLQLGAAIGACCGVVLGLAAPLVAAAIQSALIGAVLVFTAARGLILSFAPGMAGVLPAEWRGVLLTVGLITLLGLLIQWALRRREADVPGKA